MLSIMIPVMLNTICSNSNAQRRHHVSKIPTRNVCSNSLQSISQFYYNTRDHFPYLEGGRHLVVDCEPILAVNTPPQSPVLEITDRESSILVTKEVEVTHEAGAAHEANVKYEAKVTHNSWFF
jgi:hypothetical protein